VKLRLRSSLIGDQGSNITVNLQHVPKTSIHGLVRSHLGTW